MLLHLSASTTRALVLTVLALWLFYSLDLALGAIDYDPGVWNGTCRYQAFDVKPAAFFNSTADGQYSFPLDRAAWVTTFGQDWWQSCVKETNSSQWLPLQRGTSTPALGGLLQLPCGIRYNGNGNIDYWEEQGCDQLLLNNCYCYAVGKDLNTGYCEPGLGGTGKRIGAQLTSCTAANAAVLLDGGVPVTRQQVYNSPPTGTHYIALAVEPADPASGRPGDYHFWRWDSTGFWSSKPGVSLARNFYKNGTLIADVELPYTRGKYTDFCGYFDVDIAAHKLAGTGYTWSVVPYRYAGWKTAGFNTSVERLPEGWSAAWEALYSVAYFGSGYVEQFGVDAKESGFSKAASSAVAAAPPASWMGSPSSSRSPFPWPPVEPLGF
jgi:hypothetical protein